MKPTEICHGHLAEVIDAIRDSGLHPMRARISVLKSGGQSSVHRDAPDGEYAVRQHIPLMTNEAGTFACEEGSAHLAADESTNLLRVNRVHHVGTRHEGESSEKTRREGRVAQTTGRSKA